MNNSRYYFIVQRKGLIPDVKKPVQNAEAIYTMAKELVALYPEAEITKVTVTEYDLWAESAHEHIAIAEAYKQIEAEERILLEANNHILQGIEQSFGKEYLAAVIDCLKDGEASGGLKIVDMPKGDRQEENWEDFDHIFVNQTCNGGYTGDSFSGYFYIPLPDGKYLETYYSM
jgi:hypothetical protein